MTTWQELRTQIRRTILKDTAGTRYDDSVMLDSFTWACQTLCEHTALATSVTYTGATATEYDLPGDVYEKLDVAGAVILTEESTPKYLNPVRYDEGLGSGYETSTAGFYTYGEKLYLTEAPEDTEAEILVRYFAYYPVPAVTDVLLIPRWAESAISFLTAAYALMSYMTSFAAINQWKEDPEKGVPEQNALRAQSDWLIKQYNTVIARHNRQDRENYFRS